MKRRAAENETATPLASAVAAAAAATGLPRVAGLSGGTGCGVSSTGRWAAIDSDNDNCHADREGQRSPAKRAKSAAPQSQSKSVDAGAVDVEDSEADAGDADDDMHDPLPSFKLRMAEAEGEAETSRLGVNLGIVGRKASRAERCLTAKRPTHPDFDCTRPMLFAPLRVILDYCRESAAVFFLVEDALAATALRASPGRFYADELLVRHAKSHVASFCISPKFWDVLEACSAYLTGSVPLWLAQNGLQTPATVPPTPLGALEETASLSGFEGHDGGVSWRPGDLDLVVPSQYAAHLVRGLLGIGATDLGERGLHEYGAPPKSPPSTRSGPSRPESLYREAQFARTRSVQFPTPSGQVIKVDVISLQTDDDVKLEAALAAIQLPPVIRGTADAKASLEQRAGRAGTPNAPGGAAHRTGPNRGGALSDLHGRELGGDPGPEEGAFDREGARNFLVADFSSSPAGTAVSRERQRTARYSHRSVYDVVCATFDLECVHSAVGGKSALWRRDAMSLGTSTWPHSAGQPISLDLQGQRQALRLARALKYRARGITFSSVGTGGEVMPVPCLARSGPPVVRIIVNQVWEGPSMYETRTGRSVLAALGSHMHFVVLKRQDEIWPVHLAPDCPLFRRASASEGVAVDRKIMFELLLSGAAVQLWHNRQLATSFAPIVRVSPDHDLAFLITKHR